MIRAIVAEDSVTARALLVEILGSDPEIQIVGEAKNGIEAVELTKKLRPDVITMDVRMPGMDGFEATREIMATVPTPIIIVTASFDDRMVDISMNALRAGALEAAQKPPGANDPGFEESARQLVAKVKAMSQVKVVRHWRQLQPQVPAPPPPRPVALGAARGKIVAIATSTGGPGALQQVLSNLPAQFPVPILVVQHITQGFTVGLASWLNTQSPFRVKVAQDGEALAPRTVYLAPDNQHLGVSNRNTVALSSAPPVGGFRPSGTTLFESVAKIYGASTVAVIMTGMGEDGVVGLRAVRQARGQIIAQDEKTCVVFGMPGAAVAAGLADMVLPLESIPVRLVELV